MMGFVRAVNFDGITMRTYCEHDDPASQRTKCLGIHGVAVRARRSLKERLMARDDKNLVNWDPRMPAKTAHKWTFSPRFRAKAFGWRSSLPIKRIKEAVSEIRQAARKNKALGAEGAVIFLERLSPAIEQVDSSSGAIGNAVYHVVETLVPIIVAAPASDKLRDQWLERLWTAIEDDQMPYIDMLPDHWGDLCVTSARASAWADRFIDTIRLMWRPDMPPGGYFKGTTACLSGLFAAGRYDELLGLLELAPYRSWHDRRWGMKALAAQGEQAAAIRYAEETRGLNQNNTQISLACEGILLSSGLWSEAYNRYAIDANRRGTYLATFRAIERKYPKMDPDVILRDLATSTPGNEGKWFAAAKSAGLYEQAVALANQSPCDPKTLIRAARDMAVKHPGFAQSAGLTALRWLSLGYGYEIGASDVKEAFDHTMTAARNAEREEETIRYIQRLMTTVRAENFVVDILRPKLADHPAIENDRSRSSDQQ